MSRRRRAVLLGGLAVLLGALAASEVSRREAEIERRVGGSVAVLVAARPIERGQAVTDESLAVRQVPEHFAPKLSFASVDQVIGARAAVDIEVGADLQPSLLQGADPGAAGALDVASADQRIARLIVVGSASEIRVGSRVDLLITRDDSAGVARTKVGLRDAEVIQASAAPAVEDGANAGLPRVALALRVTLEQAVLLAEAQDSARGLRALPRPPAAAR